MERLKEHKLYQKAKERAEAQAKDVIQTDFMRPVDSPTHSEPEGWAAIQSSLTSHRDEPIGAFRNSTAIEVKPYTWAGITPLATPQVPGVTKGTCSQKTQQNEEEAGSIPWAVQQEHSWQTQGSHSSVHSRSTPEHFTLSGAPAACQNS